MIYQSILDTVGNTPLVRLANIEKLFSLKGELYAKVESFNPSSSIKVRIAKMMIEDGFKKGLITKDTVVIEATSGNTGIGLSLVCSLYKLKFICIMPSSMSIERIKLVKAYGGEVILTDASLGMKGTLDKLEELKNVYPHVFVPSQFDNLINPQTHYLTTGREILFDLPSITHFFSSIGTGGTITGAGRFLKEKNPRLKVIAVEPAASPVLSEGKAGPHAIQGIGAGFVPEILDKEIYDEVICVGNEDAMIFGREAACKDGLLVGISSGAALKAAAVTAAKPENKGKRIVVILPDTGERYLSTAMFTQA